MIHSAKKNNQKRLFLKKVQNKLKTQKAALEEEKARLEALKQSQETEKAELEDEKAALEKAQEDQALFLKDLMMQKAAQQANSFNQTFRAQDGQAQRATTQVPLVLRARQGLPSQRKENDPRKEPQLLFLKTSLEQALKNRLDTTWEIKNTQPDTYKICKKANDKNGCELALDQSLATFSLLSQTPESMEGLNKSVEAYVEAYEKWCKQTGKPSDLEFDLTVQDKNQIKPILAVLDELNQPLGKVIFVDPTTKKEVELKAEEIDTYRNPKQNMKKKRMTSE